MICELTRDSNPMTPPRNRTARPRVLLLSQFFPPETCAAAHRLRVMAQVLHRHFDLKVVTLQPSYPSPEHFIADEWHAHDDNSPFPILRLPPCHPHSGGYAQRALREIGMSLGLAKRAIREEFDLLLASSPSMFLVLAAWLASLWKHVPLAYDIRDLTWRYAAESARASALLRFPNVGLEVLIHCCLRRASWVFTTTESFRTELEKARVTPGRIKVIPNGVAREFLDASRGLPARLPNGRLNVTYVGNLGHNQGLSMLLEVARDVAPKGIDVVLVGDGPEREDLEREARDQRLTNVIFRGYVDEKRLLDAYAACDVLFARLNDTPSLNGAVPSKLFEYMAVGKPLIYVGDGEAARLLTRAGCAVITSASDSPAVGRALVELASDPDRRASMGSKGRTFVENHYDREHAMEELARWLLRVCRPGPTESRS